MTYALPREKKFPINSKRQAISAVAYAKKLAKEGKLSKSKRDKILRKVRKEYPSINITPVK